MSRTRIGNHGLPVMNKLLIWDITSKCNLRCKHCYNANKYFNNKNLEEMSKKDIFESIDKIKSLGIKHVLLLGGEPLVKEDIFETIDYLKGHGIGVSMTTNGIDISPENMDRMLVNLDQIGVSLDGVTEETNDYIRGKQSFKKATSSLSLLQEKNKSSDRKVDVLINFCITDKNKHEIPILPSFCKDLGVKKVALSVLYEEGNSFKKTDMIYSLSVVLDHVEKLAESLKDKKFEDFEVSLELRPMFVRYLQRKYGINNVTFNATYSACNAAGPAYYMEANGSLHPCHATNAEKGKNLQKEGVLSDDIMNIKDCSDDITLQINRNDNFRSFLNLKQDYNKTRHELYPCNNCSFRQVCFPCPINYYNKKEVSECSFLVEKEREYFEEIMNMIPVKLKELPQNITAQNDVNRLISKMVDGESRIIDIVCKVQEIYGEIGNNEIKYDIAAFLLDLRHAKFIDF